ncbi:MAG: ErfK/YbiS/YcfS/YnhG family protein, partial [Thermoleophilia bacterium]|nr:ErfK/YbiS/YcfS/YnhG family protein [Thermoleophilia bacterium]
GKTLTRDATPSFTLRVEHPGSLRAGNVEVTLDGDAVAGDRISVDGPRIQVRAPQLADGTHDVVVRARRVGLLRTSLDERFTVTVDTKAPAARVISPLPAAEASDYVPAGVVAVTKLPLRLTVGSEPGSELQVSTSGVGGATSSVAASEDTRRTTELDLPEGVQQLRVLATDRAGNETTRTLRVLVDTAGPVVRIRAPRIVKDATLALPIAARDPHGVTLTVRIDGVEIEDAVSVGSTTDAPNVATDSEPATDADVTSDIGSDDAAGESDTENAAPAPIGVRGTILVEAGATEGRHTLEVLAVDSLGSRSVFKRMFVLDSTEVLGEAEGLRIGARGGDVAQLHAALLEQDVVERGAIAADLASRTYGAQTVAAVRRFQSREGMSVDGVAGGDTIAGLTLKIVVDRSANTLTLFRVGQVVKTFRVATGSPEYPTPTGDFEIQTMQENPTWTPPDSAWAKDAKVIPPGPDNPLGTRWMAIQGTVGIHGTNNPASLGYSVSHGCIRMAIPDVEELYGLVAIGTRVTVV